MVFGLALFYSNADDGASNSRGATTFSAQSPRPLSEKQRNQRFSASLSISLDEATIQLWDDWKSHAPNAMTWWVDKNEGNKTGSEDDVSIFNMTFVRSRAEAVGAQAHSWWNLTSGEERERFVHFTLENAERFGDQVKSWWKNIENASSEGINSLSDTSLKEKERALEYNFQEWWLHANHMERLWWNATVQELQHDKNVGGSWMDELKEKSVTLAEKGRNWGESAMNELKHDEDVAAEGGRNLLNRTRQHIREDKCFAESKLSLWWNTTKTAAQQTYTATTDKEEEWWNATEHWFQVHVHERLTENALVDETTKPLIYLNSSFAYSLLMNGYHWYDYSADFFLLESGLDVQINQAYCGVATSAATLNSLRPFISLPVDPSYDPHPYATQLNVLNSKCIDEKVIHRNDTYDGILHAPGGLSLQQTKLLLECNLLEGWNVTAQHVDPRLITLDDVRRDLNEALMSPTKRVIVNYDRKWLGQAGGGHFSPIGSYAKKEDAFLVMDVAKYKYPPVWVPTERLYSALATNDSCGAWDYPTAQNKLRDELLLRPSTRKEYEKAMRRLRCREMYRGYIIIEATSHNITGTLGFNKEKFVNNMSY